MILTPNHTSSLDPPAIAAALPYDMIARTFCVARKRVILRNPFREMLSRLAQAVPVDRDLSALAAGATILQRGYNLVWFPEGTRSESGELGEFKIGIGLLLQKFQIPALPIRIDGARAAMPPPGRRLRSLHRIRMTLGEPVLAEQLDACGDPQQIADALRQRVEDLDVTQS